LFSNHKRKLPATKAGSCFWDASGRRPQACQPRLTGFSRQTGSLLLALLDEWWPAQQD
jgi:hypothetical protein